MMKQPCFSGREYANKKKTTRRERFLQEMESIVPWRLLVKPIKRVYPKGHTVAGRRTAGIDVAHLFSAAVVWAE